LSLFIFIATEIREVEK